MNTTTPCRVRAQFDLTWADGPAPELAPGMLVRLESGEIYLIGDACTKSGLPIAAHSTGLAILYNALKGE